MAAVRRYPKIFCGLSYSYTPGKNNELRLFEMAKGGLTRTERERRRKDSRWRCNVICGNLSCCLWGLGVTDVEGGDILCGYAEN